MYSLSQMVFVEPADGVAVKRVDSHLWLALGDPGRTSIDINLDTDVCVRILVALTRAMEDHRDLLTIPEVQS